MYWSPMASGIIVSLDSFVAEPVNRLVHAIGKDFGARGISKTTPDPSWLPPNDRLRVSR